MDVLTYQCDQGDYMVRGVPLAATRVSATGRESHSAITDKRATALFIQASIELGFVTRADVADGIVEVTLEAREDCAGPWRVFVFLNNSDCIFFAPVLH
jgi:hypothetical protein